MADYYCDISAIGNEYQAYNDVPTTFGMPQDGNGKAGPGHAAAVAIATIDVAGCAASGTGSIGVFGVTVSSTLNASGAALATAIASAINATAGAVSSTYSAALLPLNKLVYARVNPVLSTQVQIMLRIAGVDWVGFSPTQANISPAATISNFAGGANGPFAYMQNGTTIFGKTIGTYGLWMLGSPAVTAINQSTDVVHCRTRRNGVDLSFQNDFSTALTLNWKACNYLFDNGTIWANDNGRLTAILRNTAASSVNVEFQLSGSVVVVFSSRGYRNFDVQLANLVSGSGSIRFALLGGANSSFAFQRCGAIEHVSQGVFKGNRLVVAPYSTSGLRFDGTGSFFQSRNVTMRWIELSGNSATFFVRLNGATHEVVAATGAIGDLVYVPATAWTGRIEWCGGGVWDSLGVYSCLNPFSLNAAVPGAEVICDNVFGVTDVSAGWAPSPTNKSYLWWNQPEGPNRAFRYESTLFSQDWKGNGTFPHCGVTSLQGDSWSHRITWHSAPNAAAAVTVQKLAHFFRDTSAIKTLTVQLYVPNATTFYLDELELTVRYVDSGGVQRLETLGEGSAGQFASTYRPAIASSAKVWTANGVANFSAKKLEITTAYAIKSGSEITVHLALKASRASSLVFYVSPELELS